MANYLTFSSAEPFTISIPAAEKLWDGALYYSTDTETWEEWDGTTTIESAENDGEQRIYMRGVGNSVITGYHNSSRYRFYVAGSNIRCNGNIENLLDFETVASGGHPDMASYCYYQMFLGSSLITAPELPATTLSPYCYDLMFGQCSKLAEAPELPATTLANYCYTRMFLSCTSLKLSTTKTDEYNTEYRIPTSGDGITAVSALSNMFYDTGGTFTGTPEINTTYYMAVPVPTTPLNPSALIIGLRMGRMIAGTRCARAIPPDITEAVFENGVLYILNASATQSDHILEVK